jgi:hypothetical protein
MGVGRLRVGSSESIVDNGMRRGLIAFQPLAASELCRQLPVRFRFESESTPRMSDTKFTLPLSSASRGNDHTITLGKWSGDDRQCDHLPFYCTVTVQPLSSGWENMKAWHTHGLSFLRLSRSKVVRSIGSLQLGVPILLL